MARSDAPHNSTPSPGNNRRGGHAYFGLDQIPFKSNNASIEQIRKQGGIDFDQYTMTSTMVPKKEAYIVQ